MIVEILTQEVIWLHLPRKYVLSETPKKIVLAIVDFSTNAPTAELIIQNVVAQL